MLINIPAAAKIWFLGTLFSLVSLLSFGGSIYEPKYGLPNNDVTSISPYCIVGLQFGIYACEFQFSENATFTKVVRDTIVDSSAYGRIFVRALHFNTKYYWRARSIYHKDTSSWSLTWYFTTLIRPVLAVPYNYGLGGDSVSVLNAGTSDYIFQADADSSFKTSALQTVHLHHPDVKTNLATAGLVTRFGKTYFWRAKAIQGKDSSLWSYAWRFHTGNDTLVSPANKISGTSDSINLVWSRVVQPDLYELQWDSSALFTSGLKGDSLIADKSLGKSFPLPNLHYNTRYYWRIRDIKPGDTSAWSQAWTFTTFTAPVLSTPYKNDLLSDLSGIFTWRSVGNGHRYVIEIDTTTSFNSPQLQHKNVSGESTYLSIHYSKIYYWRVRTYNKADSSPWSVVYKVTTAARRKTLIGPKDGLTDQPLQVQVYSLSNASLYGVIESDTSALFNSPLHKRDTITKATAGLIYYDSLKHLLFNTTYYYRAKSYFAHDSDELSAVYSFTTVAGPTLSYPYDGQPNIGLSTNLVVNDFKGAIGYLWQLDTSSGFMSPALLQGYSTAAEVDPGGDFYFNKWYHYRFKVVSINDTSEWSPSRRFQSTDTMFMYLPANKATNISNTPTLQWGGVIGAGGYQYQLSTDKTFATAKTITINDGDSNTVLASASLGKTYYWRARAYDARDTGNWSLVWSFTTKPVPVINAPTLLAPSNFETNVKLTDNKLSFYWDPNGVSADSFSFQLALDNTFATPLLSAREVVTYATVDNMIGHKTYYWRVRTRSGSLTSAWSTVYRLTTGKDAGIADEPNAPTGMNIYPDPATSYFTIELPGNNIISKAELHDFSGKLVRSVPGNANTLTVPAAGLAPGIYLVKVESGHGMYYQKMVVK